MRSRNAKKIKDNITTTQFEEAMGRYAVAECREMEINKMIEAEVDDVFQKYQSELVCLAQGKNTAFEIAHAYCLNNKEKLFGKRRSIATLHGIAGFRLGTPRLKTAKGSNWSTVLSELKKKLPEYIRTAEEPAKDKLLADRLKENVAPQLFEIGVQVIQDELFYIETKKAA